MNFSTKVLRNHWRRSTQKKKHTQRPKRTITAWLYPSKVFRLSTWTWNTRRQQRALRISSKRGWFEYCSSFVRQQCVNARIIICMWHTQYTHTNVRFVAMVLIYINMTLPRYSLSIKHNDNDNDDDEETTPQTKFLLGDWCNAKTCRRNIYLSI